MHPLPATAYAQLASHWRAEASSLAGHAQPILRIILTSDVSTCDSLLGKKKQAAHYVMQQQVAKFFT